MTLESIQEVLLRRVYDKEQYKEVKQVPTYIFNYKSFTPSIDSKVIFLK